MGVGLTAYIEFSQDSFESVLKNRTATKGGLFLWHNNWLFGLLGKPTNPPTKHPIGFRGPPKNLSVDLVRENYLLISRNAPDSLEEKKAQRKFSNEDTLQWLEEGLQIHSLQNHDLYRIELESGEDLVLDPGCELPSWATGGELRELVANYESEESGQSRDYNRSVFRWIDGLTDIYGEQGVRLVYWFDSVPPQFLAPNQPG